VTRATILAAFIGCFGCQAATDGAAHRDSHPDSSPSCNASDSRGPFGYDLAAQGDVYVYAGCEGGIGEHSAWSITGTAAEGTPFARVGQAVASAGDVNRDGFDDVIVGSVYASHGGFGNGHVAVYLGGSAGLSATMAWSAADDHSSSSFGQFVRGIGDVDGDGYADIAAAVPFGASSGADPGYVNVYTGGPDGPDPAPSWRMQPVGREGWETEFGYSLAATDLDGDGFSDLVVGADEYFTDDAHNMGRVFVFRGSAMGLAEDGQVLADPESEKFATQVAAAGDVDGDGFGDVLVTSFGDERRVRLYRGGPAGLDASAAWAVADPGARFGDALCGPGDTNGDGYDDVLVGTPGHAGEASLRLYLGGPDGLAPDPAWTGLGPGEGVMGEFGRTVLPAGDVDRDGRADVIVGGWVADRVWVYFGSDAGMSEPTSIVLSPEMSSGEFVWAVGGAGDVDGDGFGDVIIGKPRHDR
jgi:hypothetical protein